jgi:hypothetical protein
MFVSDEGSYFSRFAIKFLEIFAAGLATAVSGYLIAHLSGTFSSSAPAPVGAVIQAAPTASTVSTSTVSSGPSVQPVPPVSAEVHEEHLTPQEETGAPAIAQPPDGAANAAKAVAVRKHIETDTSAAESKRHQETVLARVRAALANNSDAKRTKPPDVTPRQANAPQGPAPIGSQPRPVDDRRGATSLAAAPPNSANPQPPPAQQSSPELAPLAPVEIEPRPVAPDQAEPAAPAQEGTGVLSTLERLRNDPLAATDDAPRPPMPVGQ